MPNSANASGVDKAKRRRSSKACHHCHSRKIRCNVTVSGTPCSNCVEAGAPCHIRRRKNQRAACTPPPDVGYADQDQARQWQAEVPSSTICPKNLGHVAGTSDRNGYATGHSTLPILDEMTEGRPSEWTDPQPGLEWNQNQDGGDPIADSVSISNGSCDFSHLIDFDDIFAYTGSSTTPAIPQTQNDLTIDSHFAPPNVDSGNIIFRNQGGNECGINATRVIPASMNRLSSGDFEYLRREGCFDLPPVEIFREMMRLYFRMAHPNLPIIIEDEFWSLWHGDDFQLGNYSLLLVRAMVFAATSYTELDTLSTLGFLNKREARNFHFRQAKLIFDFEIESDPIRNAQACLLLTYQAPNYNTLRLNSYWLTNAMRFAKIARADSFRRINDPAKARLMKRLWWGVLFRDRILSLGLRRSLQVEFRTLDNDDDILNIDDFESEIGRSPVHDANTQLRIVEVLRATCRLMQCLTPALKLLYRYERLDERLEDAASSLDATITEIQRLLEQLQIWHDRTITIFPFPVSLDDAHETICIYANMLFSYHSATVFALNLYMILIQETVPSANSLIPIDDARGALETANNDISRRTQELVQVRLVKFLPVSASALMALPLILQAINVAAARGSGMENVEIRKLDVFTRTLETQQQNFEGSDFCIDVLANIVAYAQNDESFVSSMISWRDSKEADYGSINAASNPNKAKLDWANLVYKRPRLFLRLVLYLDYALCTGVPPQENDFPAELRRDNA